MQMLSQQVATQSNLALVQEAAIGMGADFRAIVLDFGALRAVAYQAARGWFIAIAGDELHYQFRDMASALDFACAEARLASAD